MALKRVFLFTCDVCGHEGMTENYGGIPNFPYVNSPNGIEHFCPTCTDTLKKYGLAANHKKDSKQLVLSPLFSKSYYER